MLKLARRDDLINIINETEIDKAISVLENEILGKKDSILESKKRRLHTRINTSFSVRFKYYNESNEIVNVHCNYFESKCDGYASRPNR